MFAIKEASKLVEKEPGSLALDLSDGIRQTDCRGGIQKKMDMVVLPVNFEHSAVDLFGNFPQSREQKISPPSGEYMPAKFHTTNDVVSQAENAMACCLEFLVPNELAHSLEALYLPSLDAARKMLKHRHESSSKFYRSIPCVIAKSLIAKYQRNPKCRQIRNLVLPICGDKGRQIKLENGGIRIPAIFKKAVIPIAFRKAIIGHIRGVEFYRRNGKWLGILCYNTAKAAPVNVTGCIGVDRNSVGNVAVFADPHTGTVRKLGLCPAKTKAVMRGRRKNLQKTGKFQLLSKLRRKQRRRMTHENHRVSKTLVDYAAKHCRAVAIEKLDGVRAPSSKIRRYSEKNQWAFAQLETFLRYKCALRGVPVIAVAPAWTSQTCCRCGSRHKPNGKLFSCGKCGRTAHRDVNASFVIAKLGLACIGGGSDGLDVSSLRYIGDAQAEKDGAK